MKKVLTHLLAGLPLSRAGAHDLMQDLLISPIEQQAAVLTLLAAKTRTVDELLGMHSALQNKCLPLSTRFDVVDIVGTGGDGKGSFNISTAASLVVASSGAYVAKHGGRAASSLAGSSEVLTALGIQVPQNQSQLTQALTAYHFAFISAGLFNPALRPFADLRKSLGIPTVLNILGPLLNPLRPRRQVIGVFQSALVAIVAEILCEFGVHHAFVVHSHDGLDELSLSAPTRVAEIKNARITHYSVTPAMVGLSSAPLSCIIGGTPAENAQIITDVLCNQRQGPMLDVVLFNAAAGLVVAGSAPDLSAGVLIARELIASGKAGDLLKKLQTEKLA